MPVRLSVRVTPRSSKNIIVGHRDDVWHLKVTAPPVDAAANAAVVELMADSLHLPKRAVQIVSGAKSRLKTIQIDGLDAAEIQRRLSAILA